MKTTERCVQCKWTIAPDRIEEVWRDGERIPLHRGGCPRPEPLPTKKP